jgi:ATP-dependent helicase/nuclease subunit A
MNARTSMNATSPTPHQRLAIEARGNVLVVAGAGAGKTQTVVDRCRHALLDPVDPIGIDQILMVTFTNAAAAEMRQRLRARIELDRKESSRDPALCARLDAALALLDTAHICTLHSFCLQLVARHFSELGLDPTSRVLPQERAHVLERECLDSVLEKVYATESASAKAIQQLIQAQGGDWDLPVRELILRLHHYTQTLRDPAAWFVKQKALFSEPSPRTWMQWLTRGILEWRDDWMPLLRAQPPGNLNAAGCAAALAALPAQPSRAELAAAVEAIREADDQRPRPKGPWRDPIKKLFEQAEFLRSLCAVTDVDPLAEDWGWTCPPMLALLDLAGQFQKVYDGAKRREAAFDFHDLEQYSLRLLWEHGKPSQIAEQWRAKLRLIFVDEYQDINEAQEAIIQALGREGAEANRFLVGDVKQSIYGFRLADPRIFQQYQAAWDQAPHAQVIPLSENFRSHETILRFVNTVFSGLMRAETGGVEYTPEAHLRFGHAAARAHLAAAGASTPPIELHICAHGQAGGDPADAPETVSAAEREARLVGERLLELKNGPPVLFDRAGQRRAALWSDMVILLRSHRHKVETYAKEFHRLGIPLAATRGGFYESLEIRDLLGLLKILDNPLQDLLLLGVLHSPLVGLTAEELATIRAGRPQGRFWTALESWHRGADPGTETRAKVNTFFERYAEWRRRARRSAVSHGLEYILEQTHYADWLATQERGGQKRANVERLLQLTRQFDDFQGESLYQFLRLVEAQEESEAAIEPAAGPVADAVRLMSIHQSKGLEFPVVVVADLGKRFNRSDLSARIILDEEYGLCPRIQPPGATQFYPSLPWWLGHRRQERKLVGEEMRLLYVALTRAAQRLILCGTTSQNRLEKKWPDLAVATPGPTEIMAANSYLDWLGPWLLRQLGPDPLPERGENELLCWQIHRDGGSRAEADPAPTNPGSAEILEKWSLLPEARARLLWHYPHIDDTLQPAKTSVTMLRRQINDAVDEESFPLFAPVRTRTKLSAADTGLGHHRFLQWLALDQAQSSAGLKGEVERMVKQNLLTSAEAAALDLEGLSQFWKSEVGRAFLEHSGVVQRELAFTARFKVEELRRLGAPQLGEVGNEEFVVVQGVVDLAAILPGEIWLVDFKTDHFREAELPEKIKVYQPQLTLYALALERIHRRPVTRRCLHFLALRKTVAV